MSLGSALGFNGPGFPGSSPEELTAAERELLGHPPTPPAIGLFASEDAPKELLDYLTLSQQAGGIAMYRLLRERVLGLPSKDASVGQGDASEVCLNCSRPESDHSQVGNLCSLGAGFRYTPRGADPKEGA